LGLNGALSACVEGVIDFDMDSLANGICALGDATVTLGFWRDHNGESQYEVLRKTGTLHIVRQPPINSLRVGIWDRLGALAKDLIQV
jgi:hypothetical protein